MHPSFNPKCRDRDPGGHKRATFTLADRNGRSLSLENEQLPRLRSGIGASGAPRQRRMGLNLDLILRNTANRVTIDNAVFELP